eukprot:c52646_g1_i1.p1 GENE.c52646_g1_i1~~c52646_g1_i1.p1  ORF type:complete len:365 (+),score=42.53 c52646_g1_i1:33-1097(+)
MDGGHEDAEKAVRDKIAMMRKAKISEKRSTRQSGNHGAETTKYMSRQGIEAALPSADPHVSVRKRNSDSHIRQAQNDASKDDVQRFIQELLRRIHKSLRKKGVSDGIITSSFQEAGVHVAPAVEPPTRYRHDAYGSHGHYYPEQDTVLETVARGEVQPLELSASRVVTPAYGSQHHQNHFVPSQKYQSNSGIKSALEGHQTTQSSSSRGQLTKPQYAHQTGPVFDAQTARNLTSTSELSYNMTQILAMPIFDNPQIVDQRGMPLSSQAYSLWVDLNIRKVGDIINEKGDINKAIYPRIPAQFEPTMLSELDTICLAIPRAWRDFLYTGNQAKFEQEKLRKGEFSRGRSDPRDKK